MNNFNLFFTERSLMTHHSFVCCTTVWKLVYLDFFASKLRVTAVEIVFYARMLVRASIERAVVLKYYICNLSPTLFAAIAATNLEPRFLGMFVKISQLKSFLE